MKSCRTCKKIAKEFAGQPLMIISVSWDADEDQVEAVCGRRHEMTWVQYRDSDHKLSRPVQHQLRYRTTSRSTSDGVLTAEMMGSGSDVEGKLKKLLAKRAKQAPATVAANGTVPARRKLSFGVGLSRVALARESCISIQPRDRPAKQVQGTTQVEPILFEQGPGSYKCLGVLCPPVRKA